MAFIEVEFPDTIALMSTGGPSYKTNINPAFSGFEQRNINWSQSRGSWDVAFEHKTQAEYDELLAMFHAAQGMAHAFRMLDPSDYAVNNQYIGTGDGVKTHFQLQKTYTFPVSQFQITRPVQKPITSKVKNFAGSSLTDTVTVYDNGVAKSHSAGYDTISGHDFTLDETTGIITFASAPAMGHTITADFDYHQPVRFNLDDMKVTVETPIAGGLLLTVSGISLMEVRIKVGESAG